MSDAPAIKETPFQKWWRERKAWFWFGRPPKYIVIPLLIVALFWIEHQTRTASWKYRISLTIETPDGPKTAEVVRWSTVTFDGGPFSVISLAQPGATGDSKGEALALEVLPGRWLFGLNDAGGIPVAEPADRRRSDRERAWAYRTGWIWGEGRDIVINPETVYEVIPHDATFEEERAIRSRNRRVEAATGPRETYPGTLVTFRDITDPTTMERVDLADLQETFGQGVSFVSGRYEFAPPWSGRTIGRVSRDLMPWLGNARWVDSTLFDTEIFSRNR